MEKTLHCRILCEFCMMFALEPNVARPKTAVKRRGGHTAHEVSHCLLYSFCVSNVHKRKHSADITLNDTCTCATIDTAMIFWDYVVQ